MVQFDPNFGKALLVVAPVPINGTGTHSVMMMKGCVEGDEMKVKLPTSYNAPPYLGGMGMAFIKKLNKDQLSKKTKCKNKAVILKGTKFDAEFTVTVPAQQPTPSGPVPDTTLKYQGKGQFVTTNTAVKDLS